MSRRLTAAVLSFATLALASLAPLPQAAQERAAPPARRVVLLETGGKFDSGKPVQEQPGFAEHLAHVERLARDGTLLLGGPLLDGAPPKLSGGLWVVQAASEAAARKLVGNDPMVVAGSMRIAAVRGFLAGAGAWIPAARPVEEQAPSMPERATGGRG